MLYTLIFKFKLFLKLLLPIAISIILLYFASKLPVFRVIFARMTELNSSSLITVTTGRSSLWDIAFDILFNLDPLNSIKGIGYGMYTEYSQAFYSTYLYNSTVLVVHNTFLSMWVEAGMATFLFLVFTFVLILFNFIKKVFFEKTSVFLALSFILDKAKFMFFI